MNQEQRIRETANPAIEFGRVGVFEKTVGDREENDRPDIHIINQIVYESTGFCSP
jgi:hypothetical protein